MKEIKIIVPRNEVVVDDGSLQLNEGEILVDVGNFNDFVEPLYDESIKNFVEGASEEKLKDIESERTKRVPLSEAQKLWDMVDYLINAEYN